jgi:20S proteasome alpha/beta subunit
MSNIDFRFTKYLLTLDVHQKLGKQPLTIILGLKCKDGVIIASDSQQEFGRGVAVKRLNAAKIYRIGERFAMAGAGTTAHIEKAIDSIRIALEEEKKQKGQIDLCEDECVSAIEKAITATYKVYNVQRSVFLEDSRERNFFQAILICGCLENVNGKNDTCLFIIHSEGIVEKIEDYATAGSGAAYAELLLKNYYSKDMSLKEAIPIAIHTIDEVKEIDPNCGGLTRMTLVKIDGNITELSIKEIDDISSITKPLLGIVEKGLIPKILRGEINEDALKKIIQ